MVDSPVGRLGSERGGDADSSVGTADGSSWQGEEVSSRGAGRCDAGSAGGSRTEGTSVTTAGGAAHGASLGAEGRRAESREGDREADGAADSRGSAVAAGLIVTAGVWEEGSDRAGTSTGERLRRSAVCSSAGAGVWVSSFEWVGVTASTTGTGGSGTAGVSLRAEETNGHVWASAGSTGEEGGREWNFTGGGTSLAMGGCEAVWGTGGGKLSTGDEGGVGSGVWESEGTGGVEPLEESFIRLMTLSDSCERWREDKKIQINATFWSQHFCF